MKLCFQFLSRHFDFSLCYPVSDFDERTVMWDLNYFKYCFLKGVGIEFNESLLEDEFDRLASLLLSDNDNVFLYRDFQSRNVMLKDGKPYFIDFQGGRRGPIYYDVASFLHLPEGIKSIFISSVANMNITKLKDMLWEALQQ